MRIEQNEGSKFWMGILNGLKNRGVQDILIAAADGLTGFPDAAAAVFPETEVQLCIVRMVRSSVKYAPYKDRKAVAAGLKEIYLAPCLKMPLKPPLSGSLKNGTRNILPYPNPGR